MEANQYPTLLVAPPSSSTKGPAATKLARVVGMSLDPWQSNLNDIFLATDDKGKWASDLCVLCVGRQNGKSHLILNLILRQLPSLRPLSKVASGMRPCYH